MDTQDPPALSSRECLQRAAYKMGRRNSEPGLSTRPVCLVRPHRPPSQRPLDRHIQTSTYSTSPTVRPIHPPDILDCRLPSTDTMQNSWIGPGIGRRAHEMVDRNWQGLPLCSVRSRHPHLPGIRAAYARPPRAQSCSPSPRLSPAGRCLGRARRVHICSPSGPPPAVHPGREPQILPSTALPVRLELKPELTGKNAPLAIAATAVSCPAHLTPRASKGR
ncbi:hypothetical protein C8Q77DRAFT_284458 [Trametes polyzona]|nr:hypothetical protein C8Q77DRAFT_284458 [Trametes polyzona]